MWEFISKGKNMKPTLICKLHNTRFKHKTTDEIFGIILKALSINIIDKDLIKKTLITHYGKILGGSTIYHMPVPHKTYNNIYLAEKELNLSCQSVMTSHNFITIEINKPIKKFTNIINDKLKTTSPPKCKDCIYNPGYMISGSCENHFMPYEIDKIL